MAAVLGQVEAILGGAELSLGDGDSDSNIYTQLVDENGYLLIESGAEREFSTGRGAIVQCRKREAYVTKRLSRDGFVIELVTPLNLADGNLWRG